MLSSVAWMADVWIWTLAMALQRHIEWVLAPWVARQLLPKEQTCMLVVVLGVMTQQACPAFKRAMKLSKAHYQRPVLSFAPLRRARIPFLLSFLTPGFIFAPLHMTSTGA
ncbi:hypothetical protein SRHO_G00283140 [Serrasalmus rhombeus]